MFFFVLGKITDKNDKFVVVENGGIGYKIFSSENILADIKEGSEVKFYTYLHVREDIFDLYGFLTIADRDFFEMLISISGIGPKGALGVLSVAPVNMIKSAVLAGDASIMTHVSGIGQKTAEKIILELKSKIKGSMSKEDVASIAGENFNKDIEALDALVGLGYGQASARDAIKKTSGTTTEAKVTEALKILGK